MERIFVKLRSPWFAGLALLCALSGCQKPPDVEFTPGLELARLPAAQQAIVHKVLLETCGPPAAIQRLDAERVDPAVMKRGFVLYHERCVQCHGATGDGNGPVAQYLVPRPRDYRKGMFKFTSTPYGAKPRPEDLLRILRQGIAGTSMPSFRLLPERDLQAVTQYVTALAQRGELETILALTMESDGELDPEVVQEFREEIGGAWKLARYQVVPILTPQPEFKAADIVAGKLAFLSKGCSKCHGDDGRGLAGGNVGLDTWGNSARAADLTSGMLRGGQRAEDIYRRIHAGINGTPMPSFAQALGPEPETFWQLVAYVQYVSNLRRNGVTPPGPQELPALPGVPGVPSVSGTASPAP